MSTEVIATREVELDITGMTCGSCANGIERKLNALDGVVAEVNFATERAFIQAPASVQDAVLIDTVTQAGYAATLRSSGQVVADDAAPDEADGWRLRATITGALALPVVALSMVPSLQFDYWQWVTLALTVPAVGWGGWPFHRAAVLNLRRRATTMDTLISIGTLSALGWSAWAMVYGDAGMRGMRHEFSFAVTRGGTDNIYLEAAAGVTALIVLGRFLEVRAKRRAGDAIRALLEVGAKEVVILVDGADGTGLVEHRIAIDELTVGTDFVVRPGEKVATDGVVVSGESSVDNALITGESRPIDVAVGSSVIGGTVNGAGRLVVTATSVGADTQLAQLARLVEQAQRGKAAVQRLADRISGVFVPVVLALASLTFVGWAVLGEGTTDAFTAAIAVVIIACPCALGLATPTALMVGTGRGAQLGIVIQGAHVLESTRRIDTVVFDKTGTLTTGVMTLSSVTTVDGVDEATVLGVAAAIESHSEHPVAAAIVAAAPAPLAEVGSFHSVAGLGVIGVVEGHQVIVGRPALLEEHGIAIPAGLMAALAEAQAHGATAVVLARDGQALGVLAVADAIKPTSAAAVAQLQALGLTTVLLTGDADAVGQSVARSVGIERAITEVLPADKVSVVAELQAQGHVVAMVGDGINDAAALAQADLGLAMGAGTDVAIAASDITIMSDDLHAVTTAIRLSQRTLAVIKGNLFWAFAYNVAGIPLAALGLLNPLVAGGAMALSSLFVVTNSLRLRRFTA